MFQVKNKDNFVYNQQMSLFILNFIKIYNILYYLNRICMDLLYNIFLITRKIVKHDIIFYLINSFLLRYNSS